MPLFVDEQDLAALLVCRGLGPWEFRVATLDLSDTHSLSDIGVTSFGDPVDIEARRKHISDQARSQRALRLLNRARNGGARRRKRRSGPTARSRAGGGRKPRAERVGVDVEADLAPDIAVKVFAC